MGTEIQPQIVEEPPKKRPSRRMRTTCRSRRSARRSRPD
jgi:hypothetical protein